jgi:hypothetical protein
MQIHFELERAGRREYLGMAFYRNWQQAKGDVVRSLAKRCDYGYSSKIIAWTYIEGDAKRLFSVKMPNIQEEAPVLRDFALI